MTAQKWLARSARLDSGDGRTELMRATCFRHLGQVDRWPGAMQLAEQKGAPAQQFERERLLALIESGTLLDGEEQELAAVMLEAGVSPHEVFAAFVHCYLNRQQPEKAKVVLDGWSANYPEEAHVAYMMGVFWRSLGEVARAEREFENALTRQPRHELARAALADLMEGMNRFDEALEQYAELAILSGGADTVSVSVARLLRKLGYLDRARAELELLASRSESLSGFAVERGQLELECGNYEAAQRWFEQAGNDQTEDQDVLISAASAFALDGLPTRAEEIFTRVDKGNWRFGRSYDLRVRLAVDPANRDAAAELERLSLAPDEAPAGADESGMRQAPEDRRQNIVARDLYALHCAACHGISGDGNGRAARHLFPRPRDLRTGKFRLVSTRNGVPTLEDLERGLRQGMPGTSMRSFENLSEDERKLLAEEVLRLNREGIREQFIDALKSEGEEIDEEEVRQVVELCTTPGEAVHVPRIGPPDSQAIARGQDTYFDLGCDNCHGDDGTGAWDTPLFDDKGRPSPPRDLMHDAFKGGGDPESIYLRVLVGMPGTPHPSCWYVSQDRLVDLVHYCRWLAREPKRVLTNHQRAIQATGGAYSAASGGAAVP